MATFYIHEYTSAAKGAKGEQLPIPSGFRGSQPIITTATKVSSSVLNAGTKFVELCSIDGDHLWEAGTSPDADNTARARILPQNVLGFYEVRGGDTISVKTA